MASGVNESMVTAFVKVLSKLKTGGGFYAKSNCRHDDVKDDRDNGSHQFAISGGQGEKEQ